MNEPDDERIQREILRLLGQVDDLREELRAGNARMRAALDRAEKSSSLGIDTSVSEPRELSTVAIRVESLENVIERTKTSGHGAPFRGAIITFTSVKHLVETLTANRWAIVAALTGTGPLAVPELARKVGRDVWDVHDDAEVLAQAGVINRTEPDVFAFPYAAVRAEFGWTASE